MKIWVEKISHHYPFQPRGTDLKNQRGETISCDIGSVNPRSVLRFHQHKTLHFQILKIAV